MEKRGSKIRKYFQVNTIPSNLNHGLKQKNKRGRKKINRQTKKVKHNEIKTSHIQNSNILAYIDEFNNTRKIQFIFNISVGSGSTTDYSNNETTKISDIFFNTYRELFEKNLLSDGIPIESLDDNISAFPSEFNGDINNHHDLEFDSSEPFQDGSIKTLRSE